LKKNIVQIEQLYELFLQFPSVQTDTRKIKKGDLFFALKGPNFNGNLFAEESIKKGAAYAIVDEPLNIISDQLIQTKDVLTTLQALAKFHRQQFKIPFIAITGSNGKTTTKELVSTVLSSSFNTYTTQGNLNNHIGVPLTILSIQPDAEIAVIEMGANHQKEIEGYCAYTLPTHGIITNCGKAHLEGFGGIEGVKKGKGELFNFLRETNGIAFVYNDFDYLKSMSIGIPNIIEYGTESGEVVGNATLTEPFLEVVINKPFQKNIKTQLVGDYNLPNVLCAVAIGNYFNISSDKIKTAIENYTPSNSRSQMLNLGSNKIILDAYNANPTSTKAAIENFAKIQATEKIIMLGGMMELGEDSISEHETIINLIQKYQWSKVVLVGGDYKNIQQPYLFFNNSAEAKVWFEEQHFQDAHVLIKGSRSMQMEKIIS
jgi:UDP-N-acetylmuramoyl-tripeptide--D-alanyl-D-alanine ligase